MKCSRLDYIDIYKAIGILFMVAGHCNMSGEYSWYRMIVPAFNMLMFF